MERTAGEGVSAAEAAEEAAAEVPLLKVVKHGCVVRSRVPLLTTLVVLVVVLVVVPPQKMRCKKGRRRRWR